MKAKIELKIIYLTDGTTVAPDYTWFEAWKDTRTDFCSEWSWTQDLGLRRATDEEVKGALC